MRRSLVRALALLASLASLADASGHVGRPVEPHGDSAVRAQVARSGARFVAPDPAIVKVLVMTPEAVLECSGAVISPSRVITAAHCLIDDRGQWRSGSTVVIPGLDGWRREPWGRFTVGLAVEEGFDYRTGANDIAVLRVERNEWGERIGDVTGWFERSPWRLGQDMQGYAGLLGEQQHEWCASVRYYSRTLEHDCFAPRGTSGSPIFYLDEATGETYIVGINSRLQAGWAVATRLSGAMWDFVESEVLGDP